MAVVRICRRCGSKPAFKLQATQTKPELATVRVFCFPSPINVRKAFRKYLECGIFGHGFARARCGDCGHDYFVAFSCTGRGVCPSCNTRRMAETAAHLSDRVFPWLPVRQWVLSVPKRLRYFMQRDEAVLNTVMRIFLRVIAQSLQAHSPTARVRRMKDGVHYILALSLSFTGGCCATAPAHRFLWSSCVRRRPKSSFRPVDSLLSSLDRSNCPAQRCLGAQNPCHTYLQAIEFPIRKKRKSIDE